MSGRVEDEHGDSVEGVLVEVRAASPARGRLSGRFCGRFPRERVESDEEGFFSLVEVRPAELNLSARGAGYIASEQVELIVAAGEERSGVVLRVRRGVELSGTVSDARGRPVTGATIMVMREMKAHLSGASLGMSHGRSDAEGHYVVEGIDPDAEGLLLRVRHGDYPSHARSLDLEPGANRLDLILEASVSVAGLVLSPGGDPVAGAMAGLQGESRNFSRNPDTTLSTADGSFEIAGVPAGTYQLFAVKEGYARSIASEPVEVAADRDVRGLAVYLSRGGTIKGRILGLESAEVSQVQVFATDGQTQHLSGFVDPSGEYRVAHVGFTEGTVGAIADGRGQSVAESFDLDTEGGETWVDLEFPQGGSILDGVVLIDGEPWRGVRVMVRGGGDSVGSASTDGSGHFKIHGLRDGSHELTLLGSSTSSHTETVEILGNTEIAIDITSVRISGSVLDSATWEGISGALVVAGSDAEPFSVAAAQAATLQSGHFEIVLPANRSVTLTARADGFAQESISLDTGPGGEITGVELALERAGELELYVRLSSGLHPNMVSVGVLDGAGTVVFSDVVFGTTEEEIRLRSIPPGEWILLVAAAGGATVSVPISVPGPPVAVTLPPEARISVDLSALAEELGFGTLRLLSPGGEPFRMVVSGQVLMEWPVMGFGGALAVGACWRLGSRAGRRLRSNMAPAGDDRGWTDFACDNPVETLSFARTTSQGETSDSGALGHGKLGLFWDPLEGKSRLWLSSTQKVIGRGPSDNRQAASAVSCTLQDEGESGPTVGFDNVAARALAKDSIRRFAKLGNRGLVADLAVLHRVRRAPARSPLQTGGRVDRIAQRGARFRGRHHPS